MRLFLYLDIEKISSLYAQEFEGMIEKFIDIKKNKINEIDSQKGSILSGNLKKFYNMNEIEKIETKYLHDFLYTKLEEKIESQIKKISNEEIFDFKEISTLSFIKVTGEATFFDANSLIRILDKLKIMEKIFSNFNKQNLSSNTKKNRKRDNENNVDFNMVKDIKSIFETFNSDLFEVELKIGDTKFTSNLNEKYLKEEKEKILYKLSINTEVKVTLFGIVTQSLNKKVNDMEVSPNLGNSIKEIGKYFSQPMEIFQELIYGKAENEVKVDPIALYLELK